VTEVVGAADVLCVVAIGYFILFRELVKGAEDVDGDLTAGYRTLSSLGLLHWPRLLVLALPLVVVGLVVTWSGVAGRIGQVGGVVFLLLLVAALSSVHNRRLRSQHLPGTLLKVSGFCGFTLLWGLG